LVLLSLVAVLTWEAAPHRVLGLWVTTVILLVAARAVWSQYARRPAVSQSAIVWTTRVMMTALGLAWGGGALIVARYLPLAVFSIIVMALAGLLAGAINTLVADRWAFPLYAV